MHLKILTLLALAVLVCGCKGRLLSKGSEPHLYKIIAHRGGYLENGLAECSIASLKETIREHCYGSECDVMWTADGEILVCHPDDEGKVNGLVPSRSTLAEIRAAGRLSNDETMPSLADFLRVVKDKTVNPLGTKLWLDIKGGPEDPYGDKVMEASAMLARSMDACSLVEFLVPWNHPDYPGTAAHFRNGFGIPCAWNGKIASPEKYGPEGWMQVQFEGFRRSESWPPDDYLNAGLSVSIWHTPPALTGVRGYKETGFEADVFPYYSRLKALFVNHPQYVISRLIEEGYEEP